MPMTFPVKQLIEGRGEPVTATPDEPVQAALERMMEYDFSQLPVIDADCRPIGMITSNSIMAAVVAFGVSLDLLSLDFAV